MSGAAIEPRADSAAGERGLPHLTGLDGIRGLAALAVVLFHAGVSWLPAGFLGVDVFFVVSGFLITALLVSERERDSNTDLAKFWLRRARRLLPVLALVLVVTTIYAAIMLQGTLGQHLHDVLMAAIYVTNWDLIIRGVSYFEMFERPSQLRHLWSLAVEEQFYIVWPILFTLVMRFLNLRWLWCIVAGLAVMSVIWMVILFTPGDDPSRVYFGSDPRAFTILIGVAVGLFWKPWRYTWGKPVGYAMDLVALLGMVVIVGIMVIARHWTDWMYPWGLLLTSLCAIVLVAFVVRPGSLLGRMLEISPLRWLGQRSYSIYLWHWPVLLALQWEFGFEPDTLAIVAVGLLATFALSELSYRFVETPMRRPQFWNSRRYRGRIANPHSVATVTAAISIAVLLALVVGFAVLPGRSPSQLMFSASAEQSGRGALALREDNQELQPGRTRVERASSATEPASDWRSDAVGDREPQLAAAAKLTITKRPSEERVSSGARVVPDNGNPAPEPATRAAQPQPLIQYPPGEYFTSYTVAAGDSPFAIMRRFDVNEERFIDLNGERVMEMIHPGDVLTLPCPGVAPCAFVRLNQVGEGCVDWDTNDESGRLCKSATILAALPIRFMVNPKGPLDDLPTWAWNSSESRSLDFVVLLDDLHQIEGEPLQLDLRFGLPPLAIGDSVMVGARSRLEAVGIEVDAEVNRQAHTAIAILAQDVRRNGPRDTVIFHAVGTSFLDAKGFRRLLDAAEGVRHLIVVTRQFPPREPLLSFERDTNKMLREEAAKHHWVTLVDWNEISDGREDELTWDGTHLNAPGRQLYTDAILEAVTDRPPTQFAQFGG